jgi:hypothetical protein
MRGGPLEHDPIGRVPTQAPGRAACIGRDHPIRHGTWCTHLHRWSCRLARPAAARYAPASVAVPGREVIDVNAPEPPDRDDQYRTQPLPRARRSEPVTSDPIVPPHDPAQPDGPPAWMDPAAPPPLPRVQPGTLPAGGEHPTLLTHAPTAHPAAPARTMRGAGHSPPQPGHAPPGRGSRSPWPWILLLVVVLLAAAAVLLLVFDARGGLDQLRDDADERLDQLESQLRDAEQATSDVQRERDEIAGRLDQLEGDTAPGDPASTEPPPAPPASTEPAPSLEPPASEPAAEPDVRDEDGLE